MGSREFHRTTHDGLPSDALSSGAPPQSDTLRTVRPTRIRTAECHLSRTRCPVPAGAPSVGRQRLGRQRPTTTAPPPSAGALSADSLLAASVGFVSCEPFTSLRIITDTCPYCFFCVVCLCRHDQLRTRSPCGFCAHRPNGRQSSPYSSRNASPLRCSLLSKSSHFRSMAASKSSSYASSSTVSVTATIVSALAASSAMRISSSRS